MITTAFFYILSYLFSIVSALLPNWQIWPDSLLNSIQTLSTACQSLNFLIPVSDLFDIFLFLIQFEVYYITAKIVVKIANYVRGTGSGLDI